MAVIPRTAEKVYKRKVDADEEVLYVKPRNGSNYVRIHRHTTSGKLYNSYSDVISEKHFTQTLRKGTKKLTAADWEKIKKAAKRKS